MLKYLTTKRLSSRTSDTVINSEPIDDINNIEIINNNEADDGQISHTELKIDNTTKDNKMSDINIIEQAFYNMKQMVDNNIQKQYETMFDAIYKVAKTSINSSNSLDKEFIKVFPELENYGQSEQFNPSYVIDIKQGKCDTMYTRNQRAEDELLPNRQVMGEYWVDYGVEIKPNYVLGKGDNCFQFQENKITINSNVHMCFVYGDKYNSVIRKEHRNLFHTSRSIKFEIDNYLNLYHKEMSVYLMFNKTAFPKFPFYSKQNVFQSKRLSSIPEFITVNNLNSIDNQPNLFVNFESIIPDDYYNIVDYFDRFRKMSQFNNTQQPIVQNNITPPRSDCNIMQHDRLCPIS
jgi:hypothetical protein